MASIDRLVEDVALDSPTLIEGFPGVGLVGKIAADHLIDSFEMTHYAKSTASRFRRWRPTRPNTAG